MADISGNIAGGGIAGAEKAIGIATILQELHTNAESLLANPATSGYGFYRLGKSIDDYFIKSLTKGKDLTKEQLALLDKFSGKEKIFLGIASGISAMAVKTAAVTAELRRAGIEFGKFANLGQLPGGIAGAANTVRDLKLKALATGGTSEFVRTYEESAKALYRQMQFKANGVTQSQQDTIIGNASRYNQAFGVNAPEFITNMLSKYRGHGVTYQQTSNILDQLISKSAQGQYGTLGPSETVGTYQSILDSFVKGGVSAPTAIPQAAKFLGMLSTAGISHTDATGKRVISGLGQDELTQLSQLPTVINPQIARRAELGLLSNYGISKGAESGDMTNILASVQNFIKRQTGGANISNIGNLPIATQAKLQTLGKDFGLNDDLIILLNNMDKLDTSTNAVSKSFAEAARHKYDLFKSNDVEELNRKTQEEINKSKTLMDILAQAGSTLTLQLSKAATALNWPQWKIDLAGLLVGGGITIGAGKMATRGISKGLENLGVNILKKAGIAEKIGVSGEGAHNKPTVDEMQDLFNKQPKETNSLKWKDGARGKGSVLGRGALGLLDTFFTAMDFMRYKKEGLGAGESLTRAIGGGLINSLKLLQPNVQLENYKDAKGIMRTRAIPAKQDDISKDIFDAIFGKEDRNDPKKAAANKAKQNLQSSSNDVGVVKVVFSTEQGQQLGSVVTQPGTQQIIRLFSSGAIAE
jgi:hypothetical protein